MISSIWVVYVLARAFMSSARDYQIAERLLTHELSNQRERVIEFGSILAEFESVKAVK